VKGKLAIGHASLIGRPCILEPGIGATLDDADDPPLVRSRSTAEELQAHQFCFKKGR